MKTIQQVLKQWRTDRNITEFNMYVVDDINCEIDEAQAETAKAQLLNYIEEIADVAITAINAIGLMGKEYASQQSIKSYYNLDDLRAITSQIRIDIQIQAYLLLCSVISVSMQLIRQSGFNAECVIMQKVKVINSRLQEPKQKEEWLKNGAVGKWQKDPKQDRDTLYVPDFKGCRI
jgi:hypothetical protein